MDGENFPAAPIEAIVARHPDVMLASVYGVPDIDSGDQVMAALVLRDGVVFDPDRSRYVARRPERPQSQVASALRPRVPDTAHHSHQQGVGADARPPEIPRPIAPAGTTSSCVVAGEDAYRPFTASEETALHDAFVEAGRAQAWDL